MKDVQFRKEMTDEDYKLFKKMLNLALIRILFVWGLGLAVLFYFGSK